MADFRVALAKLTRKFESFISNIPDLDIKLQMQLLQSTVGIANDLVGYVDLDNTRDWSKLIKAVKHVEDVLMIIPTTGMLSAKLSKMCNTIGEITSRRIGLAKSLLTNQPPNIPAIKENTLNMFLDIGNALKMLKIGDPGFFNELGGSDQQTKLDEIFTIMQNAASDFTVYDGPESMHLDSMRQTTDNTAIWNVLSRLTTMMDKQEKRRY